MSSRPHSYCFERLLTRDRWESDVRVQVDAGGRVVAVDPDEGRREDIPTRGHRGSIAGGGPRRGAATDVRREPSDTGRSIEHVPGWTVPGVPNVHSHAFQRAMAGLAEGRGPDSFWSWRDVMYRFVERLSPDDVQAVAAQLYVEMLKAGFTCVGEFHYLHHDPRGRPYDDPAEMSRRILAAARTAGIGIVLMPALYERGGLDGEPLEGGQRRFRLNLEDAAQMHELLANEARAPDQRVAWALHSLRAAWPESVGRIGEVAAPGDTVHIHVAEQVKEVRDCVAALGARPVRWLLDHAPVGEGWCLVHATHCDPGELVSLARSGAVAGLCPTTEANLGDGIFPLGDFAALGGRLGIGTDSHVSRSPVEELRLLDYGQRLTKRSRSAWAPDDESGPAARSEGSRLDHQAARETGAPTGALDGAGGILLKHAWEGGGRALGWNGGGIAAGSRADFVVLDAEHPALTGREGRAVLDSWVFSGTENPVRDVMAGGRWVVRDGRHERQEAVGRAFRKTVKRLR